jgi:hypothetical protein
MSLTKRLMRLWVQNHLADELCHSFYWGLSWILYLIVVCIWQLIFCQKNKFQLWFVCVCVMLQMIDDTDLGFFANFLGICIFVLVVAYHYVVADPKYEVH